MGCTLEGGHKIGRNIMVKTRKNEISTHSKSHLGVLWIKRGFFLGGVTSAKSDIEFSQAYKNHIFGQNKSLQHF